MFTDVDSIQQSVIQFNRRKDTKKGYAILEKEIESVITEEWIMESIFFEKKGTKLILRYTPDNGVDWLFEKIVEKKQEHHIKNTFFVKECKIIFRVFWSTLWIIKKFKRSF